MDEQGSPSNLSEAREKNEGFIRKRQAVFLNSDRQGDQFLAFPASFTSSDASSRDSSRGCLSSSREIPAQDFNSRS